MSTSGETAASRTIMLYLTRILVNMFRPSSRLLIFLLLFGPAVAQQEQSFSSRANLVLVPTLVRGESGNPIYGLVAKDFIIEDDGVEQTVHLDEAAEAEPISLLIAVQCGRRAKREFPRMLGLAAMLGSVLSEPKNEVALLQFDSNLNLVSDFTNDANLIEQDLQNLQPGDRGAAILDAVAYSAKLLNKREKGHQRVLLLISETRDHGSHFTKLGDVVELIGVTNTVVYALPFAPYLSQQLDVLRGANKDEWSANVDIISKLVAVREAMRRNTPRTLASMTGGEYQLFTSRRVSNQI